MGSFNVTSCISHLPIRWGDEVVVFLLRKVSTDNDFACYPSDRLSPLFLPFKAEYYDYGSVDCVVKDSVVEVLEHLMGIGIDEIIEIFANKTHKKNRDYSNLLREDNIGRLKLTFHIGGDAEEFFDSVSLNYEHRAYYDALCNDKLWVDKPNGYTFIRFPEDRLELAIMCERLLDLKLQNFDNILRKDNTDLNIRWEANSNGYGAPDYNIYRGDEFLIKADYGILSDVIKAWNKVANDDEKLIAKDDYYSALFAAKHAHVCALASKGDYIVDKFFNMNIETNDGSLVGNNKSILREYEKLMDSFTKGESCDAEEFIDVYKRLSICMDIDKCLEYLYPRELVGWNFPSNSTILLNEAIREDVCNHRYCTSTMGLLNLFFGESETATQSIEYKKYIELEKVRVSLMEKGYKEYEEEEDDEYDED